MADAKKPSDDEHIEELLSQLQGIFGRLSESEEEESRDKMDLPESVRIPASAPIVEPPPVVVPPAPEPVFEEPARASEPLFQNAPPMDSPPDLSAFEPTPVPAEEPMPVIPSTPIPEPEHAPIVPEDLVLVPMPAPIPKPDPLPVVTEPPLAPPPAAPVLEPFQPSAAPAGSGTTLFGTSPEELAALGKDVTPAIVFYPPGRETEAKVLTQKLETLSPKFTKVAFQLKVILARSYDVRLDLRDQVVNSLAGLPVRAVFMITEKPTEEAKKHALLSELEPRRIYVQEVPLLSVEKKAFYTDLLLGMVFFFDSLKPANGPNS